MKRTILIFLTVITTGLTNNIQSQKIYGQLISRYQDKIDSLPEISVAIDSIYTISGIDGFFKFNNLKRYPSSILISGYIHPKIKITNLPVDYKSLDLGKIELIEHLTISPTQYDSIRTKLIKSFKTNELSITQQQKANSFLKLKYKPVQDWGNIIGYIVSDSITNDIIQNPFNDKEKIKVDYDVEKDIIILDYNKFKK